MHAQTKSLFNCSTIKCSLSSVNGFHRYCFPCHSTQQMLSLKNAFPASRSLVYFFYNTQKCNTFGLFRNFQRHTKKCCKTQCLIKIGSLVLPYYHHFRPPSEPFIIYWMSFYHYFCISFFCTIIMAGHGRCRSGLVSAIRLSLVFLCCFSYLPLVLQAAPISSSKSWTPNANKDINKKKIGEYTLQHTNAV